MDTTVIPIVQQIETPRIWTIILTGGLPFQLKIPTAPVLEHEGTSTVWKMQGTRAEVLDLVGSIKEASGAYVRVLTEEQTEAQTYERMELLGLEPLIPLSPPLDPNEALQEIETLVNNPR